MKKLYKDIRFTKGILTLTAGLLIAGCSAEDELGNNSSAQQLNMIPMVNDLQKSRANDEDALHEKTLSKLDFKMFEPEFGKCCVNHQSPSPAKIRQKYWARTTGRWISTYRKIIPTTTMP